MAQYRRRGAGTAPSAASEKRESTTARESSGEKSATTPESSGEKSATTPESTSTGGKAMEASRTAIEQLAELTNLEPEGISRMEPQDDGWLFQVEMVELERIPDSTSILASYEIRADKDGNVVSYRRNRRYTRNQAGDL
ncbi:MAG TPA: gas vesicle protein GvpO [Actinopolymorphaceae bacterium]|jgi:hypothetical protein